MTREEAIKILRDTHDKALFSVRNALETLIPELHESEDERIRKAIKCYVEDMPDTYGFAHGIGKKEMLAYLEKQKDASKAIEAVERIDKYIDQQVANAHDMEDSNPDKKYYLGWDAALGEISGILKDVYSGEKQKEQKEQRPNYCHYNGGPSIERCKYCSFACSARLTEEQKPAEWSEEDKKALQGVTEVFMNYGVNIVNYPAFVHWLKDLPNRITLQLKQEWNEEDETKLRDVVRLVEDSGHVKSIREHYEKFLTSLPERFNLRPEQWSEEDKKMLEVCSQYIGNTIPTDYDEEEFTVKDCRNWLKSLPERFNLQPKQEWSDEDELMRTAVIQTLERFGGRGTTEMQIDWLKSLRPQLKQGRQIKEGDKVRIHCRKDRKESIITIYDDKVGEVINVWDAKRNPWGHIGVRLDNGCNDGFYEDELEVIDEPSWKPSEEQMDALAEATMRDTFPNVNKALLESLYEQLKKLM